MDFYVRRGDSPCPFTGSMQSAMVKVITNDESLQTPFLSREVLTEALKILDATEGRVPAQITPSVQVNSAEHQQPQSNPPSPQVFVKPQPRNKNPGGLTDSEIESAKQFAMELLDLIENPPPSLKGGHRDGIMNSDLKELYSKYSNEFRDPKKALYPIIRTHVLGFQESQMFDW